MCRTKRAAVADLEVAVKGSEEDLVAPVDLAALADVEAVPEDLAAVADAEAVQADLAAKEGLAAEASTW